MKNNSLGRNNPAAHNNNSVASHLNSTTRQRNQKSSDDRAQKLEIETVYNAMSSVQQIKNHAQTTRAAINI
jgi:hypothetical protein